VQPGSPVFDLPADPAQAEARLAREEAALDAARRALEEAAGRMDALAGSAGLPSFAAGPGGAPGPEAELLALLAATPGGQRAGAVSFAPGERFGAWADAERELRELLDTLLRSIAHAAWVETRVGGELAAQSAVGWTGDTASALREGIDLARAALHGRALDLALRRRQIWMRAFAVAAEGAAKLAVLIAAPGGAVLALPAALKYVRALLEPLQTFRADREES
jgi:hypothetical protein